MGSGATPTGDTAKAADGAPVAPAERLARGLRNFNPGNLRYNRRNNWQGLADPPYDEGGYCRFKAPEFGIRAIGRLLLTYKSKYRIASVRDFVSRWAPASENDTDAYVAHVAKKLGVHPDDYIELDSYEVAYKLTEVVILHENGRVPYKKALIDEGLRLAGIADAPKKSLLQQGGFKGNATALALQASAAATVAAPEVKKAADGLEPFQSAPIVQQIVMAILTLGAILALIGMVGGYLKNRKGL